MFDKVTCMIDGDKFKPSLLDGKHSIVIYKKWEPGELGIIGRYKGMPQPYGACIITPPENWSKEAPTRLMWLLEYLARYKADFDKCGAEEYSIRCSYHFSGLCSLSLESEEIHGLAKLDLAIAIDGIPHSE